MRPRIAPSVAAPPMSARRLPLLQSRSRGHGLRRPPRRRPATPRRLLAFHFTKAQNTASNSCLKLKGKVAALRLRTQCRSFQRAGERVSARVRGCVLRCPGASIRARPHVRTREYVTRRVAGALHFRQCVSAIVSRIQPHIGTARLLLPHGERWKHE